MFKKVLPILLILHSFIADANEAFLVWHSGSLCVTSSHENIAMESEDVSIIFGENDYTVDGTFIFTNSGEDTTVAIGFPMAFGGVLFDDELFQNLGVPVQPRTWVSGVEVPFVPVSESIEYYDGSEEHKYLKEKAEIELFRNQMKSEEYRKKIPCLWGVTWYSKEVFFKKHETVITRVNYKSKYGDNSGALLAEYIYGSGKTWKGSIGKATFRIQTSPDIWMVTFPRVPYSHKWFRESEYEYVLTLENFEPADADSLQFGLSKTIVPYLLEGIFFWSETESEFIKFLTLCNEKQMAELKETIYDYQKDEENWITDEINERFRLGERFLEYSKKMNYRYEIDLTRIVEEIKEIQVETAQ